MLVSSRCKVYSASRHTPRAPPHAHARPTSRPAPPYTPFHLPGRPAPHPILPAPQNPTTTSMSPHPPSPPQLVSPGPGVTRAQITPVSVCSIQSAHPSLIAFLQKRALAPCPASHSPQTPSQPHTARMRIPRPNFPPPLCPCALSQKQLPRPRPRTALAAWQAGAGAGPVRPRRPPVGHARAPPAPPLPPPRANNPHPSSLPCSIPPPPLQQQPRQ